MNYDEYQLFKTLKINFGSYLNSQAVKMATDNNKELVNQSYLLSQEIKQLEKLKKQQNKEYKRRFKQLEIEHNKCMDQFDTDIQELQEAYDKIIEKTVVPYLKRLQSEKAPELARAYAHILRRIDNIRKVEDDNDERDKNGKLVNARKTPKRITNDDIKKIASDNNVKASDLKNMIKENLNKEDFKKFEKGVLQYIFLEKYSMRHAF